jgi:hypothetical protein
MLQNLPSGVLRPLRLFAAQVDREILDRLIESSVRMTAVEQLQNVLPQRRIGIH